MAGIDIFDIGVPYTPRQVNLSFADWASGGGEIDGFAIAHLYVYVLGKYANLHNF
tara:strand:- start:147641 stop:147805 length:165 start_codon:yes stop_codon:yes gene_type:complete